jgi:hypothetical protein
MADVGCGLLTVLLDGKPLCDAILPDEPIYRIIRGAIIYRDELDDHPAGEVRLGYGDHTLINVEFRTSKSYQG